jgi:hypothetical protein
MLQKILVAFLHLLFLTCCRQKVYVKAAGGKQQLFNNAETLSSETVLYFIDLPLPVG